MIYLVPPGTPFALLRVVYSCSFSGLELSVTLSSSDHVHVSPCSRREGKYARGRYLSAFVASAMDFSPICAWRSACQSWRPRYVQHKFLNDFLELQYYPTLFLSQLTQKKM